MFIKMSSGERFNVLLKGEFGAWIVSFDEPGAPMLIESEVLNASERVEPPEEFIEASLGNKSTASEKRYQLIKPLLLDATCITDSKHRQKQAVEIAKDNHTSKERVLRLYYRYLATGSLLDRKPREHQKRPEFDAAIKKYYFSAKRHSLRTAYELMLLEYFADSSGKLSEDVPSFDSFKMYYHRNWSKNPQKDISRDGLTNYLRNKRPLYGCAMAYREKLGSYIIDETPADIYVVSSFDRNIPLGRPNIYLAIDVASQMITGVYIGMDAGEDALLKCVSSAAADKEKYCAGLGIKISPADWPVKGMPSEIISDRGSEFVGSRATELCLRYGTDLNINQPFRPDLKAIVERNMGLLQGSYKSMLAGKGLIELDAQERWSADYRAQAVLTLEEFRKIVALSIIAVNKRVIESLGHLSIEAGNTPISIWSWMMKSERSSLLEVDEIDLQRRALPRTEVKLDRRGIFFKQMRYVPKGETNLEIDKRYTIAYDDDDSSVVFVITPDKTFAEFVLSDSSSRYKGLSHMDIDALSQVASLSIGADKRAESEVKVQLRKNISEIIDSASKAKENMYEV